MPLNRLFICIWLVLLVLITQSYQVEQGNANPDIFIPTNEWRPVKHRQHLPPGLHIRLNLNTGLTEAKLVDLNDQSKHLSSGDMVLVASDPVNITSFSEIGNELKETSESVSFPSGITYDNSKEHPREFRTYEELKADLSSLLSSVKTEPELIDEVVQQLNTVLDVEETQTLLQDLSYLLHQVDNGYYFAKNNGFALLLKFVQDPNMDIQIASLSAVAAAVQGNSRVKVIAFQNQTLSIMCNVLYSALSRASTNPKSVKLASAWLTTLSVLLRDFPSAQRYFFIRSSTSDAGLSGSDVLWNLYKWHSSDSYLDPSGTNLRTRIISFLADLVAEKTSARMHSKNSSDEYDIKLWNLYSKVPLEDMLQQDGWCAKAQQLLLNDLQSAVPETELDVPFNHSQRQRILTIVLHLFSVCKDSFSFDANVDSILANLEREYYLRSRKRDNDHDFYFQDFYDLVVKVRGVFR